MSEAQVTKYATVLLDGKHCGTLGRVAEAKWIYSYDETYLKTASIPLSLSLPLSKKDHVSKNNDLLPYFLNLIPEGWLLAVARELKVDVSSPLAILTVLCKDNIGAAEIFKFGEEVAPIASSEIPTISNDDIDPPKLPEHRRCILCHEFLPRPGHNRNYHEPCAKLMFNETLPPILSFSSIDIRALASNQLASGHAVTGVQPKLSGYLRNERNTMILRYILKPQPAEPFFDDMVRLEVSMMHFAQYMGLKCASTGMIYALDGTPVLISQRFDRRDGGGKIHCEDFAQAMGVDPGNKYDGGSLERAAELVSSLKASTAMTEEGKKAFLQICLYNYLMGNADNHLKNYSVAHLEQSGQLRSLVAPFYDLVPARLFPSGDLAETGLSLAGKKSKFRYMHFVSLAARLGLDESEVKAFIDVFKKSKTKLVTIMDSLQVPKARTADLERYIAARISDLSNRP